MSRLFCATPALADECIDPIQRTVTSPGKSFVVQFTPKKRDCLNDSCSDDPKTTGELKGDPRAPTLTMFAVGPGGKRTKLWSRLLLEGYEPMGMAVSNDGNYVILADSNWCASGRGENVVVLLSSEGEKLQSWSLEQILPADYIEALFHTTPNIHWRGGITYDPNAHGFDFSIVIANGKRFDAGVTHFLLNPADRSFVPQDKPAWDKALSYAGDVVRNRCAMREWRLRRAAVPLSAPRSTDRFLWTNFAVEIEERVTFPKAPNTYVSTWRLFLSAPNDASYGEDLKEFRRMITFLRSTHPVDYYLVSPDLRNAVSILKAFLVENPEIDLTNSRFVVVGDDPAASNVAAEIAARGGHQVKIIPLGEAVPPEAREDYDWRGKAACGALAKRDAERTEVSQSERQ